MKQPRWYTADQILENWNKQPFELIELIRDGSLKPYAKDAVKELKIKQELTEDEIRLLISKIDNPEHIPDNIIERLDSSVQRDHFDNDAFETGSELHEFLSKLIFKAEDINDYEVQQGIGNTTPETETTPAPQTIPLSKEEAEEFIRSIAISYLSDTEVIIKTKNKEVTASREDIGFKASSRPWEMFTKMLQDSKHEYHVLIYDKNKNTESLRAYNRENKLFPSFNKKFVPFLNDQFSVTLPNDFNVFKNMKHIERDGTYKPKFQIFDHRELRQQKDIKSLSKEDTLKSLKDLTIQLKRAKKEPEKELLLKEILNIGQHAKRNRWITKNHELWDLISPSDDTPSDNDIMALWEEETEIEKLF